jgi:hypothetical protein
LTEQRIEIEDVPDEDLRTILGLILQDMGKTIIQEAWPDSPSWNYRLEDE